MSGIKKLLLACGLVAAWLAPETAALPNVTASGYLNVHKHDGSFMFYTYWESAGAVCDDTPIILWLQGGPGCASHFGGFYELGPQLVTANLSLTDNPGAWNREAALLFIDQPVGTGFSPSGSGRIPDDEGEMARDLYTALQHFFAQHSHLQRRPLVIAGESYAGKYVPAIGHFVLQLERLRGLRAPAAPGAAARLGVGSLGLAEFKPPKFRLAGLAIGNGLIDPAAQVQTHADTAFFAGLIDEQQRLRAMAMQLQASQAIQQGAWEQASRHRGELLQFLQAASGAGTLLDYRRTEGYDAEKLVDRYLNQAAVKEGLGARCDIEFASCSERVGRALAADVMRSVAGVLPDLLANLPLLLYQGAFDAQDGPAASEAWLQALQWPGRQAFAGSRRHIWRADAGGAVPHFQGTQAGDAQGRVAGYWREWGALTHVVVRDAGHMVPRDDPRTAQAMIESWLRRSVLPQRPPPPASAGVGTQ